MGLLHGFAHSPTFPGYILLVVSAHKIRNYSISTGTCGQGDDESFYNDKILQYSAWFRNGKSRVASLTSSVQTLFRPRWRESATFQLSLNVRQTSGIRVQEEFNDVDRDIHGASHSQRRQTILVEGRNGG